MRAFLPLAVGALVLAVGVSALADNRIPARPRYVFQPMGDSGGLATRSVVTMVQDRQGFIWLGTSTGLFRFDGVQVSAIPRTPGRPFTYVSQLALGPDGTVWVASGGTVARYDGFKFLPVRLPFSEDRTIRSLELPQRMALDSKNNLYLATTRGILRLAAANRHSWQLWSTKQGLPDANVVAVHMGPTGRLWFAAGGKVGTLDPASHEVKLFEIFGQIPAEQIIAVLDNGKQAWVRTQTHLLRHTAGAGKFVVEDAGIAEALGLGMPGLDRQGRIWVPSRAGVFYHDGAAWQRLSASSGLRSSAVASILHERRGEMWFGLAGSGVSRWPGTRWSAWTTDNGLPDNGVWDIMRDSQGRLWVSTNNGLGIWRPAQRGWKVLRRADGIAGHGVWKTFEASGGEIWSISRRVGLNRYDPRTLTPRAVPLPAACGSGPTDLALDRKRGLLWMAGNDYLYQVRVDGGEARFSVVPLPARLMGCTEVVAVTASGVVWTGGRNGLGRYDGTSWQHFTRQQGLRTNHVQYLSPLSDSSVWIDYRTAVGISRLTLGQGKPAVSHLTTRDGLLSDTVWMLEQDSRGQLWIGHSNGISVRDGAGRIHHITRNDGLIWNDISQGGFLSLPDGSVFIGTGRGLAYHRPTKQQPRALPPTTVITSAMLGGKELLDHKRPVIGHQDNRFTVKFSGVTFHNPHAAVFRYRLAGLEQEYLISRLRQVRYSALPPGSFTFEVSCRSAAGLWGSQATYPFVIRAPWWQQWWVRVGAGVLVGLLLLLVLKLRTFRAGTERRRLELAVAERSIQLADANEKLAEANERLRELSYTDGLTQVHNGHFFSSVIEAEVSSARRKGDPRHAGDPDRNRDLVFFLVDLDYFKSVNDSFGHAAGDHVLVETARRLEQSIRQSDLLVRWGGEEFLLLCRDTERKEASVVAGRLLEVMEQAPFALEGNLTTRRTCSIGWAALPTSAPRVQELITHERAIELADRALYLAKNSGRNRAVGMELDVGAMEQEQDLSWLERPLEDLEGTLIRLVRVQGNGPASSPEDP